MSYLTVAILRATASSIHMKHAAWFSSYEKLLLPALSPTMEMGKIASWKKKVTVIVTIVYTVSIMCFQSLHSSIIVAVLV